MNGPPRTSTTHPYVTPQPSDTWASEAAARGRVGTQQLLTAGAVTAQPHVKAALNLDDDEPAVVRRRLILEDDQPVELADSYYPGSIAAGTALAEQRKIKGGAVGALANLGHTPATVNEHITARQPTPDEQVALTIGQHDPLIVLTRTSYDSDGKPVEYAVMRTVASRSPGLTYNLTVNR